LLIAVFSGLTAKEPDYCRYVDEVTARYTREMKEKYGLILEGRGGEFLYDIQSVSLSFRLYEKYSVDQIRVIIVNAEKRLMQMLNDDKKIRPYLRNFPVTPVNATSGFPASISTSSMMVRRKWEPSTPAASPSSSASPYPTRQVRWGWL
jgi:hypothetical protein